MSEIHVVVALYAKAGREESLRRDLIQVVEPSRREEGSLGYDLFVDMNDPRRFVFVERWASADAQNKHTPRASTFAISRTMAPPMSRAPNSPAS